MKKEIELGAQVWAQDGEAGKVRQVVADPQGRQPGYLVVARGRLPRRQIVVPVGLVADVSAEGVKLETTRGALDQFPDYEVIVKQGEYRKPVPVGSPRPVGAYVPASNQDYAVLRQRSVPEKSKAIEEGMAILDSTGLKVGEVGGLILDTDSRQPTHVVLRRSSPLASQQRLIPVDLVAEVKAGGVQLHIHSEHVAGLDPYEPAP